MILALILNKLITKINKRINSLITTAMLLAQKRKKGEEELFERITKSSVFNLQSGFILSYIMNVPRHAIMFGHTNVFIDIVEYL